MVYSPERKQAVLKKMLPPNNRSLADIAKAEDISEATLYNWRSQARKEGRLMPDSDNAPAGWSSQDKFAAVVETATMSQAEVAEYCRRRGLYCEPLAQWRQACQQANDWDQASQRQLQETRRADQKKIKGLEKELIRKEKALAEAAALLVLQKKYHAMFEDKEDA